MAEPTAREVLAETICLAENKLPLRLVKHEKERESYREGADILLAALTDAGYSVVRLPSAVDIAIRVHDETCDCNGTTCDIVGDYVPDAELALALLTEATDG